MGRILSITPDAIFLALCFARIWHLMRRPVVLARAGYFHFGAKCLAGVLVVASLAATTGILSTRNTGLPYITIISAGLSLASSVSPLNQRISHIMLLIRFILDSLGGCCLARALPYPPT